MYLIRVIINVLTGYDAHETAARDVQQTDGDIQAAGLQPRWRRRRDIPFSSPHQSM